MTAQHITTEDIWQALEGVKDPEIPVVSVVEMGIVREVNWKDAGIEVADSPADMGAALKRVYG